MKRRNFFKALATALAAIPAVKALSAAAPAVEKFEAFVPLRARGAVFSGPYQLIVKPVRIISATVTAGGDGYSVEPMF